MNLTYNEILNLLDIKYTAARTTGQTITPFFEISDFNGMIESLKPRCKRICHSRSKKKEEKPNH